jgi:hypothetical protein
MDTRFWLIMGTRRQTYSKKEYGNQRKEEKKKERKM